MRSPGNSELVVRAFSSRLRVLALVALGWFGSGALATVPLAAAATLTQDFLSDPASEGWRSHGATNLFSWNATLQHLDVTWDSSQTNSYFLHPLGTILAKDDDFRVDLDLWLHDIAVGTNPEKPFTFELAIGFLRLSDATRENFRRGAGVSSTFGPRNLVEWDYFPDSGFGATVWPALISSNGQFNYRGFGDYLLAELLPNEWHHLAMSYTASNRTLLTTLTRAGQPWVSHSTRLTTNFTDFRLDTFALCSYSDAGSDGSLLAHGIVDNVALDYPAPPFVALHGAVANGHWQAVVPSRTNWTYTLQRTEDFVAWSNAGAPLPGDGGLLSLTDTNPPPGQAFYRLEANRP